MGYFADLSPYTYSWLEPEDGVALNVGWLGAGQPFETGACPSGFLHRLRLLAEEPDAIMRGTHNCEFCEPPRDDPYGGPQGTGEIRVRGRDGVTYAAPVLIVHYVETHGYRPPEAFVTAVMEQEGG